MAFILLQFKGINKMAKKQFFLILDTETTIENTVADIGIVIADRQGNIHKEMAVLIKGRI